MRSAISSIYSGMNRCRRESDQFHEGPRMGKKYAGYGFIGNRDISATGISSAKRIIILNVLKNKKA